MDDQANPYTTAPEATPVRSAPLPPGIEAGRCSSCTHLRDFELPLRTIYFCRRFIEEMDQTMKDSIYDCSGWEWSRPLSLKDRRRIMKMHPLLSDLVHSEDQLFASLRDILAEEGIDIKTLMMLAHPALRDREDLFWLDTADAYSPLPDLCDIVDKLKELGYQALIDFLRPVVDRHKALVHGLPWPQDQERRAQPR